MCHKIKKRNPSQMTLLNEYTMWEERMDIQSERELRCRGERRKIHPPSLLPFLRLQYEWGTRAGVFNPCGFLCEYFKESCKLGS